VITLATKKKKDTKKTEEKDLLPVNPLIQSPVISVEEENEQKVELMEQVDSLVSLNKQVLAAKRQQTELLVDNKKLDTALKLIDGIELIADKALNHDTIMKVLSKPDLNPQDFKFLADAIEKMSKTLKDLMTPSMQDELGQRKRAKIIAHFRTPSGEEATLGVDLGNDN